MKIEQQLAVFLENRPGMLARICEELVKAKVNILALSVLDNVDHAVVRMVVDKTKEAEQALTNIHAMVQVRDVLLIEVSNHVGAMAKIAERLAAAGINLEYAYCTCASSHREGSLILRTNDLEATINALTD